MATPKPTVKAKSLAPPKMVKTAKVNKATGFTTGTRKVQATKSNPKTTSLPKSAPAKDPWSTGKVGEAAASLGKFLDDAVGQATGRIPSHISGAMHNKTPVIPYTEKNIKAIKKARP